MPNHSRCFSFVLPVSSLCLLVQPKTASIASFSPSELTSETLRFIQVSDLDFVVSGICVMQWCTLTEWIAWAPTIIELSESHDKLFGTNLDPIFNCANCQRNMSHGSRRVLQDGIHVYLKCLVKSHKNDSSRPLRLTCAARENQWNDKITHEMSSSKLHYHSAVSDYCERLLVGTHAK